MSTTRGVRTLVGVAVAASVVLLGGCSSSGTTSGSSALTGGLTSHTSAAGSTGGTATGGTTGGSSATGGSTGGSTSSSGDSSTGGTTSGGLTGGLGGSDPGCQAAISDFTSGSQQLTNAGTNLSTVTAGIKSIGDKLHADAGKTSNSAAASAINKVGDDYISLANAASSGKTPDMGSLGTDDEAMITACQG